MGRDDKLLRKSKVDNLKRTGLGDTVANLLGVRPGSELQFVLTPEGRVVVEKASE